MSPASRNDGAGLGPALCQDRAEECRTMAPQADRQELRVMLQHFAETWGLSSRRGFRAN
jgi:hypothetical protein